MIVLYVFIVVFVIGMVGIVHYESLRWISSRLPGMGENHRLRILICLAGCLIAHTAEVWIFAFAYYLLTRSALFGSIVVAEGAPAVSGQYLPTLADCGYFSLVNYTSLGYGDLVPSGLLQFLAGLEALLGLILIAWTATFLLIEMQKNRQAA